MSPRTLKKKHLLELYGCWAGELQLLFFFLRNWRGRSPYRDFIEKIKGRKQYKVRKREEDSIQHSIKLPFQETKKDKNK
jgi:hypothetical protein